MAKNPELTPSQQRVYADYRGSHLTHLPEVVVGDKLKVCAGIVVNTLDKSRQDHTRATIRFSINPTGDFHSLIGQQQSTILYRNILQEIEHELSPHISFSEELPKEFPPHPLSPLYPRCQILIRSLFADVVQDTFAAGLLPQAERLVRQPEIIDGYDNVFLSDNVVSAFEDIYEETQKKSRHSVARSEDEAEKQKYVALDTLFGMNNLLSTKVQGGSALLQERLGFLTPLTLVTPRLFRRIMQDLDDVANGDGQRLPRVTYPDALQLAVATAIQGKEGIEREIALFELACKYTRISITPHAHSMMDLKLYQFTSWRMNENEKHYINQLVPVARGGDKIEWSTPEVPDGAEKPAQGNIEDAREEEDPTHVSTRCVARRPITNTGLKAEFRDRFKDAGKRSEYSPVDMLLHINIEAMRSYLLYCFGEEGGSRRFLSLVDGR